MCIAPVIHQKSVKGNSCIGFTPVEGIFVYEFWIDGSVIPVSTPCLTDKGKYYYSYQGSLANYYSLPIQKGSQVKVRSFCMESYWYEYPKESNWMHYKDDSTKFSEYSNILTIK